MNVQRLRLDLLSLAAPMPALILGVVTMKQLGVRTSAWSTNLAAAAVGLLLFALIRSSVGPANRSRWYLAAAVSITAILFTFVAHGLDGVHRWVYAGGLGLHAAAIVAPVIIACVATAPTRRAAIAIAIATAILLVLQPDAAQATSFAAGCGLIFIRDSRFGKRARAAVLIALIACAIVSIVRVDPLHPVRYVEGIVNIVSARGPAWALLAIVTLLLLPVPFVLSWARRRQALSLALAVYVAMVTIAPAWGTFPVPIMGYGVSPILGYFIALALCARSASIEASYARAPSLATVP
jgi:cell division protein FtsW (lipid II flippase)